MTAPARPIRVMPPDLALKIAAGEVIERPASVVKELIDNAVDAGARRVRIEARDAGLHSIRVTDDGSGIPRADLPLAFQSHATSKIASLDDLERLTTLGFRGEALPSIAAVSRVEVQTRSATETTGSRIRLEHGEVLDLSACAAPRGLRVTVSDLFANVPARRKFVRSLRAEAMQIANLVAQYAQAQPGIRFSLALDGRETFVSPGTGRLEDAVDAVHGPDVLSGLLPVDLELDGVTVWGLASSPRHSRPNRSAISFFVNGRPIQNRSLGFALEEAYDGFLMTGRHPIAIVHIEVPPAELDANVHPSKSEVRFARDRAVHRAVHQAAVSALTAMRLETREIDVWDELISSAPGNGTQPASVPPETPTLGIQPPTPPEEPPELLPRIPALRVFGQTNATFIIAEGPRGLYMIDQHAAHERILFDRLEAQLVEGAAAAQPLLEPATIELSVEQMAALEVNRDLLADLGFALEPFGQTACLIRSVPLVARGGGPEELVREVLDELPRSPEPGAARERALTMVACKAAVKAGQTLDIREMREIVDQLETTARPATCPHGRPTMIHLSHSQLEREFGRR